MKNEKTPGVRYSVGTEIQYRNGIVKVKTADYGLIPKSRMIAQLSAKVIGGGEELKPGQKVFHLNMNSHGQAHHDDDNNLVVVQHRTTKYEFLKKNRVLRWGDEKPAKEISLIKTAPRQALSR